MNIKPKFPWVYLVLAYAIAWFFWIPVALTRQDYQSSPILVIVVLLGVFGPGIAGILMTYREEDKAGWRNFWRRVVDFRRIRHEWFALILLLFPSMHIIAIVINNWLGGSAPTFEFLNKITAQPIGVPVVILLYLIQAGAEELGWRGYMLDRVQAIWKPLGASLAVGVCHAFWHLPLFWVAGTNQIKMGFGLDFVLFVATALAASIFFTWCYNANRRSTLAVILFHTVGNLSVDTFMLPGTGPRIFNLLFVFGAVAIAAVWATRARGPANLLTAT